jgi:riboflavin kinase, archaea type
VAQGVAQATKETTAKTVPPEREQSHPEDAAPQDKEALKQIALIGGVQGPVELSSTDFARLIGSSQQTASRRILQLTEQGLLQREMGMKKQLLKISAEGLEVLKQEAAAYRRIFELFQVLNIRGTVQSGVGEGKYYMSQEGYRTQFQQKLGFDVYPGTLNMELDGAEMNKLRILRAHPGRLIESFSTNERTFGEVHAWKASIDSRPCAAILPKRSHHKRVLEIIAPEHLRSRFGLEDGDELEIRVEVSG